MSVGLVSISFRKLTAEEIISLCLRAGLTDLEWGGDVHVPTGDIQRAKAVRKITEEAGLKTVCYGSYYRAGGRGDFSPVLTSAVALGAPIIRIWAGGAYNNNEDYFSAVARDISNAVKAADRENIKISLECHRGTLTQEYKTAVRLAESTGCLLHFQPNPDITDEENDEYLNAVLPFLSVFHVFAWDKRDVRLPLCERSEQWKRRIITAGKDRPYLLEFVKGDSEERLMLDADYLRGLTK